jgi:Cu/Ag efflux pump CusA
VLVDVYTRNTLGLFGGYSRLARPEAGRPDLAVVLRGAGERFLPTFVATVAVAALLLPILVLGGGPGLEVLHPMAVVVLGGLLTTLATSLFVLPLAYLRTTPDRDLTDLEASDRSLTEAGAPAV